MAKRALAILIALMLTPFMASAVPVDPTAESGVAAITGNYMVLMTDGSVWYWNVGGERAWEERPEYRLPRPISDIKDWAVTIYVTVSEELWVYRTQPTPGWYQTTAPTSPVTNEEQGFSDLKRAFTR